MNEIDFLFDQKHALAIIRPVSMLAVMKIIRDSLMSSQDLKNDPARSSTDSLQPHIARYVANCLLHECIWHEANSQELFLCLPQLLQVSPPLGILSCCHTSSFLRSQTILTDMEQCRWGSAMTNLTASCQHFSAVPGYCRCVVCLVLRWFFWNLCRDDANCALLFAEGGCN